MNAKADTPVTAAKDTPEVVKESIAESGQSPEAAANKSAVLEKKAVEKELLSEIKPENSTGESAPKIASTTSPSDSAPKLTSSAATGSLATPASPAAVESRDVSPGTVPGTHTQTAPTVTTGVGAATTSKTSTAPATPAKSSTINPATPGSSKTVGTPASVSSDKADKKKKRSSIFGKIKAKLTHKD